MYSPHPPGSGDLGIDKKNQRQNYLLHITKEDVTEKTNVRNQKDEATR